MKNVVLLFLLTLGLCTAGLILTDDSFAARMGGGRSFGSQPTMRSTAPAPRPAQPQNRSQTMNTTSPRPASSGMGAMGGLFGGLLAGTLLGSLLGGGGGAAGGGGIGFIDIILFGLVIWLGLKFFRKMRGNTQPSPQPENAYSQDLGYNNNYQYNQNNYQNQGGAWDSLRDAAQPNNYGQPQVPAGFDVEEFLQGAKQAYIRMQDSWDKRDLNDIAYFATPAVLEVLRDQLRADPNPSHTEIINVNARLLKVTEDGVNQRAEVFFDVLLREDPRQVNPEPAKEIWHFLRAPNDTWKLDGIQQTY